MKLQSEINKAVEKEVEEKLKSKQAESDNLLKGKRRAKGKKGKKNGKTEEKSTKEEKSNKATEEKGKGVRVGKSKVTEEKASDAEAVPEEPSEVATEGS